MKRPINEIEDVLGGTVDLLLCSASFEPRSVAIPEKLNPELIRQVLVGANVDRTHLVKQNCDKLLAHFISRASVVETCFDDPLQTADEWDRALCEPLQTVATIAVDITTFTRETLLIVTRLLWEYGRLSDTAFLYNGAGKYSKNAEDPDKVWLSKGISGVRSVLGYGGEMEPGRRTHLVLLAGFETERASLLVEAMEPNALSLGIGDKEHSISPELYELNVKFADRISAVYGERVHQFEFPPNDAIETRDRIKEQLTKLPDHNVVIAPMNTKISTLGAGLLAIEDQELQIAYAPAIIYNTDDYATPAEDFYMFQLPAPAPSIQVPHCLAK